jgi:2-hydroxychromene-2-carboxylate isomerase
MKQVTFYFDVISPFAYLAFEQLPRSLEGVSYAVDYRPVLFAGMLQHFGQLGPAEIAPKRMWTYRHVLWMADELGIALDLPPSHPFNPLPLLRMALQCATPQDPGACNRWVAEAVFRHVWQGGAEPCDRDRLAALADLLAPARCADLESAKTRLKANTDAAIAQGVFGVPMFEVEGRMFWGLDALPMLRDHLADGRWSTSGMWDRAGRTLAGVERRR